MAAAPSGLLTASVATRAVLPVTCETNVPQASSTTTFA
jgi:hypothetical protein